MMLPLETVHQDTFSPFIGHVFLASNGQGVTELVLESVQLLGHKRPDAARDPFSLAFSGAPHVRLPQGIYRFSCDGLGDLEFFITQVGGGAHGSEFEAVFT